MHQSNREGNDVPARHLGLPHHLAVDDQQLHHGTGRSLPCLLPVLLDLAPGISQRIHRLFLTPTGALYITLRHCRFTRHRLTFSSSPTPQCHNDLSKSLFNSKNFFSQASSGIHSDIASAQSCQLLCVETEDCVAFSWHFGSDQFDENTCQLFSGLLAPIKTF